MAMFFDRTLEAVFIGSNAALAVSLPQLVVGFSCLPHGQAAKTPPRLAKNCRANSTLSPMNIASYSEKQKSL